MSVVLFLVQLIGVYNVLGGLGRRLTLFVFAVMYSFEGDFRRKPQQNLAGASAQRKTDRDSLIQQSQQQRQKREVNIWYLFAIDYTLPCWA